MKNDKDMASKDMIKVVYHDTNDGFQAQAHFHNSYEMVYVTEGKSRFYIGNKAYDVEKNDLVFISNLESHKVDIIDYPYNRYYILIKPEYLKSIINEPILISILKNRPVNFSHLVKLNDEDFSIFHDIIQKIYEEAVGKKEFRGLAIKSNICMLFLYLYRNYKKSFPLISMSNISKIILYVQKYIEDHYSEEIYLDEIADKLYVDKYYLSHTFKAITGYTFRDYLILMRISKAKDLLFYTDENITNVCINSGFNNVNNFIRTFKKFEGVSPYKYRKMYKIEDKL